MKQMNLFSSSEGTGREALHQNFQQIVNMPQDGWEAYHSKGKPKPLTQPPLVMLTVNDSEIFSMLEKGLEGKAEKVGRALKVNPVDLYEELRGSGYGLCKNSGLVAVLKAVLVDKYELWIPAYADQKYRPDDSVFHYYMYRYSLEEVPDPHRPAYPIMPGSIEASKLLTTRDKPPEIYFLCPEIMDSLYGLLGRRFTREGNRIKVKLEDLYSELNFLGNIGYEVATVVQYVLYSQYSSFVKPRDKWPDDATVAKYTNAFSWEEAM